MIESTSMASLLTERCYRSTPRGVLTAHAWWLCQCETGACQYHWCSIYRGLERVGSWVPGGSVGRDQLAMAAKVRRHWFNPCRLGSRGHLGANFSLLLYTDLIKKRKPSKCGYSFIKAAAVATDFENELKPVSFSSTVFRKATSFQTANKTLQTVSTRGSFQA